MRFEPEPAQNVCISFPDNRQMSTNRQTKETQYRLLPFSMEPVKVMDKYESVLKCTALLIEHMRFILINEYPITLDKLSYRLSTTSLNVNLHLLLMKLKT